MLAFATLVETATRKKESYETVKQIFDCTVDLKKHFC